MMARSSKGSNQRPDTLMRDRTSANSIKSSLATHGRTIHLGHKQTSGRHLAMSALPPKADIERHDWHVRFVPCVDGSELARLFFTFAGWSVQPCVDGSELARLFFTFAGWSVQPCVRPVSAAHKAAGHNALRGSGPGQKPAFDNALAHVGCSDRRIDRLCITCCPPSHPSQPAGLAARSRLRRKCDGFFVAITPGHHGPRHPCDLVGERDRGDLGGPPRQQCRKPGPMFGAMDLGIANDGERTSGEQAAQIAIALFADTAELVLAPARVLLRHKPDPG